MSGSKHLIEVTLTSMLQTGSATVLLGANAMPVSMHVEGGLFMATLAKCMLDEPSIAITMRPWTYEFLLGLTAIGIVVTLKKHNGAGSWSATS